MRTATHTATIPGPASLAPADLAELMAAFNQVTARLEHTHDQLRSEVERLRAQLAQANSQLERSRRLAALGEMAAGIAHEVRNPLGSIALYARMLREDLAAQPRERAVVDKIASACRALDVVVGDVLTFAKEFTLRRQPTRASTLFEGALEACEAELASGPAGWLRVERAWSDPSSPDPLVDVDAVLMQQALVNLIRNAIEAMREHPVLRAHTLRLECAAAPDATNAALRVIDTGPGVAPEVVARMFNPFFTTRAAGTGLGLAIVHRIIDAHAGAVLVANNADRTGDPSAHGATIELLVQRAALATEIVARPGTMRRSDLVAAQPAVQVATQAARAPRSAAAKPSRRRADSGEAQSARSRGSHPRIPESQSIRASGPCGGGAVEAMS